MGKKSGGASLKGGTTIPKKSCGMIPARKDSIAAKKTMKKSGKK